MLDRVSDFCRKLLPIVTLVILVLVFIKVELYNPNAKLRIEFPYDYSVYLKGWPTKNTFDAIMEIGKNRYPYVPLEVEVKKQR